MAVGVGARTDSGETVPGLIEECIFRGCTFPRQGDTAGYEKAVCKITQVRSETSCGRSRYGLGDYTYLRESER